MRLVPLLVLLISFAGVIGFTAAKISPDPIYRIASGSMAPHLLGPHAEFVCPNCQLQTSIDGAIELPPEVTCPNCGQTSSFDRAEIYPGHVIQWERVPLDQLQRFDLIVLEDPAHPQQFAIKRIAFLPGELPEIADGELCQSGILIRKTPRQREATKLLVYDQTHQPSDNNRFLAALPSGSGWDVRPGVMAFAPLHDDHSGESDWLVYHHQPCLPPPSPQQHEGPPKDSYAYNHSVSRELFPANDLWLEWTFRHWQADSLTFKLKGKTAEASIRIDPRKKVVHAQSTVGEIDLPLEIDTLTGATVRAGKCDGRLFLEIEQGYHHWTFPLVAAEIDFAAQPLAVLVEGGPAVLKQAKVYRDIVWLGAHRRTDAWSWERKLGKHEMFVLGDNVPISEDSRGELGAIDVRKYLQGRVLRVTTD